MLFVPFTARCSSATCLAVLLAIGFAMAGPADAQNDAPSPTAPSADAAPADAAPPGFWDRDSLTGDWGGVRSDLADQGIAFSAIFIGEVLGNPTGGLNRGSIIESRLQIGLDSDLDKLVGWAGAAFRVNAFQIAGHGLSFHNLSPSLLGASNIDATPALRLFDLSLEQKLAEDLVAIRLGQFAADEEFFISDTSANLINSTFGWPGIMAADLSSGGPAYPLAQPAIRARYSPSDSVSIAAALFAGDPAGHPGLNDPQRVNASGTSFSVSNGVFGIAEAVYKPQNAELPGTYKFGSWYQSGSVTDPNTAPTAATLATLQAQGLVRERSKAYGAYIVIDQLLWHVDSTDNGLSGFLRLGGTPSDRRPVSFYADTGLSYKGLLPDRDSDVLSFGVGYIQMSGAERQADSAIRALTGLDRPVRDVEAVVELTYQYQVTPWWLVQPDLQYDINPGAGVADPNNPIATGQIGDALVIGLRSTISF